MVIDDSHLGRADFRPFENDAPLIVYPYGMESGEISFQRFESVSGWDGEVIEFSSVVHLDELPEGHSCDGGKTLVPFFPVKLLGILV